MNLTYLLLQGCLLLSFLHTSHRTSQSLIEIMNEDITVERVLPDAPIKVGDYYLARINNARPHIPPNYAMVMIITPDLLPQKRRDGKAKASDLCRGAVVYPCWVMGKPIL
jgi:hypothetical protein